MKLNSLLWKLILAFLFVAVTTGALVAVFIRLSSADRLRSLIIDQERSSLQTSLEAYYTSAGSWDKVAENWPAMSVRSFPDGPPPSDKKPLPVQNAHDPGAPGRNGQGLFGLVDAQGVVLVSNDPNQPVGSVIPAKALKNGAPVTVDGQQVGTVITASFQPRFNPEEDLFLKRTGDALLYALLGAMLVALVLAGLLARTLIRPLQALTQAAQNIANGQLEQEVKVTTSDEIGQLAATFNQMSQEVTRVNKLRRQMTADIAHDLRTPLTVIGGYIESMRDGVLQPTNERLSLIYTEIERLQNLVGDLRMLSQVEAGELPLHKQAIEPGSLLLRAIAPFQHSAERKSIRLEVEAEPGLPEISIDEARMMQVLSNLISNALRYTRADGLIRLSGRREDGGVVLEVQDDGTGIPPEELPYIFDRFYRIDKSRSSETTGETGLGLAIVKALVEAQGGTVRAESVVERGTTVQIKFPK